MADIFGTIESLARSVQDSLSTTTIYGDPITAGASTFSTEPNPKR